MLEWVYTVLIRKQHSSVEFTRAVNDSWSLKYWPALQAFPFGKSRSGVGLGRGNERRLLKYLFRGRTWGTTTPRSCPFHIFTCYFCLPQLVHLIDQRCRGLTAGSLFMLRPIIPAKSGDWMSVVLSSTELDQRRLQYLAYNLQEDFNLELTYKSKWAVPSARTFSLHWSRINVTSNIPANILLGFLNLPSGEKRRRKPATDTSTGTGVRGGNNARSVRGRRESNLMCLKRPETFSYNVHAARVLRRIGHMGRLCIVATVCLLAKGGVVGTALVAIGSVVGQGAEAGLHTVPLGMRGRRLNWAPSCRLILACCWSESVCRADCSLCFLIMCTSFLVTEKKSSPPAWSKLSSTADETTRRSATCCSSCWRYVNSLTN